jgi:hypothetical protein
MDRYIESHLGQQTGHVQPLQNAYIQHTTLAPLPRPSPPLHSVRSLYLKLLPDRFNLGPWGGGGRGGVMFELTQYIAGNI